MDQNSHRCIWGETWLSEDPETSEADAKSVMDSAGGLLAFPFGLHTDLIYSGQPFWSARLYPKPKVLRALQTAPNIAFLPNLNTAAPESCFRLQRVGLAASGSKFVGRLCVPILTDRYYTDVPQRRHVDVTTLRPWLAAALGTYPKTRVFGGRTYKNVVFSRAKLEWSPVDHYTLQESTVRVWQRWRTYDYATRGTGDATYTPSDL